MDIPKLFDFFDQYPNWFKVALAVGLALALIGLLTLRQTNATSNATTAVITAVLPATPAPSQSSSQSSPIQTLSAFHERRKTLDGRFLELQDFLQRSKGERVDWRGYLADVSERGTTSLPSIYLIVLADESASELAGIVLPESFRVKAFSLQRGDLVRFSGVISSTSTTPQIEAETLEVVHPKSGG